LRGKKARSVNGKRGARPGKKKKILGLRKGDTV